jgi:hypothetical protein
MEDTMTTEKTTPTEIKEAQNDSLKTPTARKSELRNRIEAAEFLRLAPGTLSNWHSTGKIKIPCFKLGKRVFYRESDLTKWLEQQAVNSII